MIFEGVCTAIITPFKKNGDVDFVAFKKLMQKQIDAKVDAVCVLGTTGESSTINEKEREQIIVFAKNILPREIKLVVGTGSNNFETAKKQTLKAKALGADCALVVTPYYNKCTQNGLVVFYENLANQTEFPIIVYNVPSRTGVNVLPSTIKKLSQNKFIVGLKEANGSIEHILEVFDSVNNFAVYSGNDNLNYLFLCLGAKGVISVVSNVYPKKVKKLCKNKSFELHKELYDIGKNLFVEVNPIPVKYALYKLGFVKNVLRLPLTPLQNCNKKIVEQSLSKLGEDL